MNKDLGILCLIADMLCEAAVVLVRMSQHDAADVRETYAVCRESTAQRIGRLRRFRSDVDQRHRVRTNQINIHVTHVKRRGDRYRQELHQLRLSIRELRLSKT